MKKTVLIFLNSQDSQSKIFCFSYGQCFTNNHMKIFIKNIEILSTVVNGGVMDSGLNRGMLHSLTW